LQFQGHTFARPELFELALSHASLHEARDNERLEFLGDAALDLIVADELFALRPELSEGQMTEIKAVIVSRPTLSRIARETGLDQLARVGPGLRSRALPASVLANLFEAMLGAVYLDGGLEAARRVALAMLRESVEYAAAEYSSKNPKQRLQHLAQARWATLPSYEQLESRGSAHARAFLVRARIGEAAFPSAWGRTRKEAERWAAFEALLVLEPDRRAPSTPGAEHERADKLA
jgi:ribonuclease-3